MVPALASVFNPEVTLLGRVTARSVWVRAVFRQAALSRRVRAGFPPTKPEDRGTVPKQMFAIRLRLLRILLASPPLPMRLGLSWLSCSPPPDLPAVAEVVNPGSACHQTEAPHASRVERTRAAAQVRAPRTGFLDGCEATEVARSFKSPALCAAGTAAQKQPTACGSASPTRPRPATRLVRIARLLPHVLDRTPRLLRHWSLLRYGRSMRPPGLLRRASIELGEHVSAYPARRASACGEPAKLPILILG